MIRRLLILSLSLVLTWLVPTAVSASPYYMAGIMEMVAEQEAVVSYNDGKLLVTGAEGQTMEIISLTGKKVMTVTIESPSQKVELNIPKGCYIVKVGKVVRKVTIR